MGHYGRISESHHAVAPAGSIFLTVYNIWHRRSESTVDSAEMFTWLCGEAGRFRSMGGQGWPIINSANFVDRPYGIPAGLP